MMSDPAIRAVGLGKQFDLGERAVYRTLRDSIANTFTAPFRRGRGNSNGNPEHSNPGGGRPTFWALRDISFELQPGEVLGVVGPNGAGKSTLLKILTRITTPTEGFAEVRGRVGSLLEVGTGFHPELTGRENVHVNGSILGLTRREIARKFDSIVDFAGVETFLDTPVKRYSSGMRLRLAFAVAAHLEPDILIIDEVLAVGDAEFQKKCLGAIKELGGKGRTVLFVSHNLAAINGLCTRAVQLDHGRIVMDGEPEAVVGNYLRGSWSTTSEKTWPDLQQAPGNEVVRLCAVRARTGENDVRDHFSISDPIALEMEYEVLTPGLVLFPIFSLTTEMGTVAFTTLETDETWRTTPCPCGRFRSKAWVPGNFLAEGGYFVGAAITTQGPNRRHLSLANALSFQIVDRAGDSTVRGEWVGSIPGVVRPFLKWETRQLTDGSASESKNT